MSTTIEPVGGKSIRNEYYTLLVETGANNSVFKQGKIYPEQRLITSKSSKIRTNMSELTQSLVTTVTCINNWEIRHTCFNIVYDEYILTADSILGRDYLSRYGCQ